MADALCKSKKRLRKTYLAIFLETIFALFLIINCYDVGTDFNLLCLKLIQHKIFNLVREK